MNNCNSSYGSNIGIEAAIIWIMIMMMMMMMMMMWQGLGLGLE